MNNRKLISDRSHYDAWVAWHERWIRRGLVFAYTLIALIVLTSIGAHKVGGYFDVAEWVVMTLALMFMATFLLAFVELLRFHRNKRLWELGLLRYSDINKFLRVLP
ncbi:hypothetical protein [Vibrio barjaei]|uniref:hypothetical protein n=1 Tax=Vibrio barjaei TaxID=1676683 RepID=UPI00228338ED|nr:hypothetical protein [Vibrio barjaei]MCY9873014.1 hypothetical protein [Vibrio barjaei]